MSLIIGLLLLLFLVARQVSIDCTAISGSNKKLQDYRHRSEWFGHGVTSCEAHVKVLQEYRDDRFEVLKRAKQICPVFPEHYRNTALLCELIICAEQGYLARSSPLERSTYYSGDFRERERDNVELADFAEWLDATLREKNPQVGRMIFRMPSVNEMEYYRKYKKIQFWTIEGSREMILSPGRYAWENAGMYDGPQ